MDTKLVFGEDGSEKAITTMGGKGVFAPETTLWKISCITNFTSTSPIIETYSFELNLTPSNALEGLERCVLPLYRASGQGTSILSWFSWVCNHHFATIRKGLCLNNHLRDNEGDDESHGMTMKMAVSLDYQ